MRDHRYQPAAVHTHVYPHHGAPTSTRTSRRIDVSTCLPITDCNGTVDREGGRSFSFGRPSYFSLPHMFASFASCNIVRHSSFLLSSFHFLRHLLLHLSLSVHQSRCLLLPLFLFRQSMVLRPKGKSINSPGEIVTRNMEYWVRAKLPSSPLRMENKVPRQAAAMPCQLRRTLVRSYEDTRPVLIVRRVEGSKSCQPPPSAVPFASLSSWRQTVSVDRERLFEFRNLLSWRRPACVPEYASHVCLVGDEGDDEGHLWRDSPHQFSARYRCSSVIFFLLKGTAFLLLRRARFFLIFCQR